MRGAPDASSGVRASAWGVLVVPMCEECRQFSGICAARASTLPRASHGADEASAPPQADAWSPGRLVRGARTRMGSVGSADVRRVPPVWRHLRGKSVNAATRCARDGRGRPSLHKQIIHADCTHTHPGCADRWLRDVSAISNAQRSSTKKSFVENHVRSPRPSRRSIPGLDSD